MSSYSPLDERLHRINSQLTINKETRSEYNAMLKEMLETYLLANMEEDALYNLLYQRTQYVGSSYENLKIRAPDAFDLNFVLVLGLPPSVIEIEYNVPGCVQLKLPSDVDKHLLSSRVWRDACSMGLQQHLLNQLHSWTSNENYLLQSSVIQWFEQVVEKALSITTFPNFRVRNLCVPNSVVLELSDIHKDRKFTITMQPVFAFPVNKLPSIIASSIPHNAQCEDWMVECRSHPSGKKELWGLSLWQHEKKIINNKLSMKPIIRLIKGLRDGQDWKGLTSYMIKTLFMLELKKQRDEFWRKSLGDLLMHMLLQLRNQLLSSEGIPFYWDERCDLLCGLSGNQRVLLAQLVTKERERLELCLGSSTISIEGSFGVESPPQNTSSACSTQVCPHESSSISEATVRSGPELRSGPEFEPRSTASNMMTREGQGSGWMWAVGGAAAIGAVAAIAIAANRKKSKKP